MFSVLGFIFLFLFIAFLSIGLYLLTNKPNYVLPDINEKEDIYSRIEVSAKERKSEKKAQKLSEFIEEPESGELIRDKVIDKYKTEENDNFSKNRKTNRLNTNEETNRLNKAVTKSNETDRLNEVIKKDEETDRLIKKTNLASDETERLELNKTNKETDKTERLSGNVTKDESSEKTDRLINNRSKEKNHESAEDKTDRLIKITQEETDRLSNADSYEEKTDRLVKGKKKAAEGKTDRLISKKPDEKNDDATDRLQSEIKEFDDKTDRLVVQEEETSRLDFDPNEDIVEFFRTDDDDEYKREEYEPEEAYYEDPLGIQLFEEEDF